jgi:chromosome segregation ATPase
MGTTQQILVVREEPSKAHIITNLISPDKPNLLELQEISQQHNLVSQKLNTWVTHFVSNPNGTHKKGEIMPTNSDKNHLFKEENLALTEQIQRLQTQLKGISKENNKFTAEKGTYTTALSTSQALSISLQEQNTTLENQQHQLKNQLQTAAEKIQELNLAHEAKEKSTKHKWQAQNKLILAAVKKMTQIHSTF